MPHCSTSDHYGDKKRKLERKHNISGEKKEEVIAVKDSEDMLVKAGNHTGSSADEMVIVNIPESCESQTVSENSEKREQKPSTETKLSEEMQNSGSGRRDATDSEQSITGDMVYTWTAGTKNNGDSMESSITGVESLASSIDSMFRESLSGMVSCDKDDRENLCCASSVDSNLCHEVDKECEKTVATEKCNVGNAGSNIIENMLDAELDSCNGRELDIEKVTSSDGGVFEEDSEMFSAAVKNIEQQGDILSTSRDSTDMESPVTVELKLSSRKSFRIFDEVTSVDKVMGDTEPFPESSQLAESIECSANEADMDLDESQNVEKTNSPLSDRQVSNYSQNGKIQKISVGIDSDITSEGKSRKRKHSSESDHSNSPLRKKSCDETSVNRERKDSDIGNIVQQFFRIRSLLSKNNKKIRKFVNRMEIAKVIRNFFRKRNFVETQQDHSGKEMMNRQSLTKSFEDNNNTTHTNGNIKSEVKKTMRDIMQEKKISTEECNTDVETVHASQSISVNSKLHMLDVDSHQGGKTGRLENLKTRGRIGSLHEESLQMVADSTRNGNELPEHDISNSEITSTGKDVDDINLAVGDDNLDSNKVCEMKPAIDKNSDGSRDANIHENVPTSENRLNSSPVVESTTQEGPIQQLVSHIMRSYQGSAKLEDGPFVLREGNISVIIGIPATTLAPRETESGTTMCCDAGTQASSQEIDFETGIDDPTKYQFTMESQSSQGSSGMEVLEKPDEEPQMESMEALKGHEKEEGMECVLNGDTLAGDVGSVVLNGDTLAGEVGSETLAGDVGSETLAGDVGSEALDGDCIRKGMAKSESVEAQKGCRSESGIVDIQQGEECSIGATSNDETIEFITAKSNLEIQNSRDDNCAVGETLNSLPPITKDVDVEETLANTNDVDVEETLANTNDVDVEEIPANTNDVDVQRSVSVEGSGDSCCSEFLLGQTKFIPAVICASHVDEFIPTDLEWEDTSIELTKTCIFSKDSSPDSQNSGLDKSYTESCVTSSTSFVDSQQMSALTPNSESVQPPLPDSSNDLLSYSYQDEDTVNESESSIEVISMSSSPEDSLILTPPCRVLVDKLVTKVSETSSCARSVLRESRAKSQVLNKAGDDGILANRNSNATVENLMSGNVPRSHNTRLNSDSTIACQDWSDSTVLCDGTEMTQDDLTDCPEDVGNGTEEEADERDTIHRNFSSSVGGICNKSENENSHDVDYAEVKSTGSGRGWETDGEAVARLLSDETCSAGENTKDGISLGSWRKLESQNSHTGELDRCGSSPELGYELSQRASQMQSRLPEMESSPEPEDRKQDIPRILDFKEIVLSDSSDSDLPDVLEFLRFDPPTKSPRIVQNLKLEPKSPSINLSRTVEAENEETTMDSIITQTTKLSPDRRKSKKRNLKRPMKDDAKKEEPTPKKKVVKRRSPRKRSEIVKKTKNFDCDSGDSDIIVITGSSDSESEFELGVKKKVCPVKDELSDDASDREFPNVTSLGPRSGKRKMEVKIKSSTEESNSVWVDDSRLNKRRIKSGSTDDSRLNRRRIKSDSIKKRSAFQMSRSRCKPEVKDQGHRKDESDSSDDLQRIFPRDVPSSRSIPAST